MNPNTRVFLEKLASLLEEHQAELFYTKDDDGVHVSLPDDRDILVGIGAADIRKVLNERRGT